MKELMRKWKTTTNHSVIRLFGYSVIDHSVIDHSVISKARYGFTLVEMLVVIGIIAVLISASLGGYTAMTKAAEKARAQELVLNVATALTALFQQEGAWPRALASKGATDGELDKDAALPLAADESKNKLGYFSLQVKGSGKSRTLFGNDRFGILTPWATTFVKRRGASAQLSDIVSGSGTVRDHILHYALDLDGDGIIRGASVGGKAIDIRATAAVWCGGKDGSIDPYPYAGGGKAKNKKSGSGKSDDVYSWTPGQTTEVE